MRAALPTSKLVAPTAKAVPTAMNMRPDRKSFWLLSFIRRDGDKNAIPVGQRHPGTEKPHPARTLVSLRPGASHAPRERRVNVRHVDECSSLNLPALGISREIP